MSCCKFLKSFYDLRNEVITFLEIKEQNVAEIKSVKWVQDLAFPVDNHETPIWFEQNIRGKNKLVTSTRMCDSVKKF
jgi:hypothetical protein